MSRIIAPQWVNRRKRGSGLTREEARRLSRTARFPDQISGLQLFLDARSLGLSDGNSVSTWEDLSGNSHDVSQGTGSAQPTYRASGINGRPAVEFDGSDDLLTSSAFGNEWSGSPGAPMTIAGVVEWQSTTSDGFIFSPGNSADGNPLNGVREESGNWQLQVRGDSGGGHPQTSGSATDTNPHVMVARQEETDGQILRLEAAEDIREGSYTQGQMTFDQVGVGALHRDTDALFAHIRIGVLLAYNTWVEDNDLDLIEQFLADAYGVAI